jgi:hypothetical protein
MTLILEDRLSRVLSLPIRHGSHSPPNGDFNACVMEAVSYVAGEEWSDTPACVCPVIGVFLRSWNDSLQNDEDRTRLLRPLIAKVVGTKATPEVELARVMLCVDWSCREWLPAWLDLVPSLVKHAVILRSATPIQSWDDFDRIVTPMRAAQKDSAAAWDAAWAAARVAARDAAWDAADKKLAPTVDRIRQSAVALVERMCAIR